MMKILEDANEVVRETAKDVVIELFKYNTLNSPSLDSKRYSGPMELTI